LRHGVPSLLLTNTASGIVVPTFVFYSALPYVLPVALNLIGLPALVAFKIASALMFVVMGGGLHSIVDKVSVGRETGRNEAIGCLCAVLFVAANYVFALWTSRASLGEFFVYALIPWVVSAALSEKPAKPLILVFFLQIAAHPIVFAHSMLCEAPVILGLSRLGAPDLARRSLLPLAVALLLAVPFWLPQMLWEPLILGPRGLPADFQDSFLSMRGLLDPKSNRNIGLWIPLAIVTMIALTRGRLPWRSWMLIEAWAVLMALQTLYLAHVTARIPTLSLSLFVWRLMLPAAFLGFAALYAGWPSGAGVRTRSLSFFAGAAVLTMAVLSILAAADYVPRLAAARDDRSAQTAYDTDTEAAIWGIREYWPNYASLSQTCPPAGDRVAARFDDLRAGLGVTRSFVTIDRSPIGMVDYIADGKALQPAACEGRLVLGPLEKGATLRVSEAKLDALMALRGVFLAALAVLLALLVVRRPTATRAA
jgi:hypothetical protein